MGKSLYTHTGINIKDRVLFYVSIKHVHAVILNTFCFIKCSEIVNHSLDIWKRRFQESVSVYLYARYDISKCIYWLKNTHCTTRKKVLGLNWAKIRDSGEQVKGLSSVTFYFSSNFKKLFGLLFQVKIMPQYVTF